MRARLNIAQVTGFSVSLLATVAPTAPNSAFILTSQRGVASTVRVKPMAFVTATSVEKRGLPRGDRAR